MSRRATRAPAAAACRSSSCSMRRPRPIPRIVLATQIRFSSAYSSVPLPSTVKTQHTAADRDAVERRDEDEPARGAERRRFIRRAASTVEATLEALVELGEVGVEARPGVWVLRVARLDADERRGEQPLDGGHRVHERRALTSRERLEDRSGSPVRAAVELRSLASPGARRAGPSSRARRPRSGRRSRARPR